MGHPVPQIFSKCKSELLKHAQPDGVDEAGLPIYAPEVAMYDEAAYLLQKRFNPCWISSWGYIFALLTAMAVVHAFVINVWYLVLEPHFYGELRAPDHT